MSCLVSREDSGVECSKRAIARDNRFPRGEVSFLFRVENNLVPRVALASLDGKKRDHGNEVG